MNVLLGSKVGSEAHFGSKSVMAINLLGMNFQGEKAWKFTPPGMNEGFEITIGLYNDVSCAMRPSKKCPQKSGRRATSGSA